MKSGIFLIFSILFSSCYVNARKSTQLDERWEKIKKEAESMFAELQNIDGEIPEMKRDLLKTFLMYINLGPMTTHDILENKFPKLSDALSQLSEVAESIKSTNNRDFDDVLQGVKTVGDKIKKLKNYYDSKYEIKIPPIFDPTQNDIDSNKNEDHPSMVMLGKKKQFREMFEGLYLGVFEVVFDLQKSLEENFPEIKEALENVDEAIELITAQYPSEADRLKEVAVEVKITVAELDDEVKQLVESIRSHIENNAGKYLDNFVKEFKDSFAAYDGIFKEMYSKMHEELEHGLQELNSLESKIPDYVEGMKKYFEGVEEEIEGYRNGMQDWRDTLPASIDFPDNHGTIENAAKAIPLSEALKTTIMWGFAGLTNDHSPSHRRILIPGKEMENLTETPPEFQEMIEIIKIIAEHFKMYTKKLMLYFAFGTSDGEEIKQKYDIDISSEEFDF